MLRRYRYRRRPTLEVAVGAAVFVAALAIATIVITSREPSDSTLSADAPGTWTVQQSGTSATLLDVDFVDAENGWAVGENGTVLHTSDAGQTWETQDSGTTVELASVAFPSPNEGWAVGKLGVIIHTSDGGETWGLQGIDVALGVNLIGVTFSDERNGQAITVRGSSILRTRDGGETWTREFISNTTLRSDWTFPDSMHGWIAFNSGGVLHTADGGETWDLRKGVNGVRVGQSSIFFLDENRGWIAGWRGRRTEIRSGLQFSQYLTDGMVGRTTDGGLTWTRHDAHTGRFLWDVVFLDENTGWTVGSFGTVLYSEDGGVTWKPQVSNSKELLRRLTFPDPDNGWAVGDNGTILKFTAR